MLALLLPLALAAPEDALDEATRPFFLQGAAAEEAHAYRQAAASYRLVLARDPGFAPAALGLGRALEAAGESAAAEALYRGWSTEPDAVEALARLVEARDPVEALALWRRLETLRLGDPVPFREQARLLAATDPDAAVAALERYRTLLQGREPDGEVVLAVGAGLLAAERTEAAEALWMAHVRAFPDAAVAPELQARLDRLDVERAAEALALGGSEPLPPGLAGQYGAAQASFAAGRLEEAEAAARSLVAGAPRSAEAHALLADVLVRRGTWEDAEIHAVFARTLAPDEASNRVRLGMLLSEAYAGRRDREARDELREASVLRPADVEIQVVLGRLCQRLQDWSGAVQAYEAALAAGASGPAAGDIRARLAALARTPPTPPTLPEPTGAALPVAAEARYRIALVLARRGRATEAIAELDAAIALAPTAPQLLNKRARLAREVGAPGEAERWLLRSLEADADQPAVLLELAQLARTRGAPERAEALYEQAAARGSADAHFHLAELAVAREDWGRVESELAAYDAAAPGRASLNATAAAALRAQLENRLLVRRVVGGLVLTVLLGVPLAAWARWRTARTLRDLLDGSPECWHDAARLLAALRHEVLKHNTTVLPDVADALARGDTAPWEAFRARAPALLQHFRRYLEQLEALGRRHGMRLGLRWRDPVLAPMHRALTRLARLRRPRPEELRALSGVVNEIGYAALGRLVREICVLPVGAARVREVYQRVCSEPGFVGTALPALEVHALEQQLAVRMFRADLEDILANLLRNALAAGTRHLDVGIGAYDDPITGHAWVEVAVIDDAPGALTNAMIRGRYIGRGLGLAVDLINRHGGSIRVESREAGRKAVVVQLPAVESAALEVEWTVA